MNKGLEILLARMETNPDEFTNNGRWVDIFNQYKKYMSGEEQDAFMSKLKALKMEEFEQRIVKHLLQADNEYLNKKPTRILTTSQITNEALKILAEEMSK